VHVERAPCVHPPYCPTPTPRLANWVRILSHRREDRAPPCDLPTSYITSRASIGECAPPHAAQEPNNRDLSKQLGPACQRTSRVVRVTAAPAPSYVGRVVHVATLRAACSQRVEAGVREHTALLAVGRCLAGWVCTVSQGAQLTAAGWRAARGGWHCAYLLSSVSSHARRRDTHHTARAVLSAGTSTNTGGRWHADTR
jgi:hypothetical protein